MNLVNPDCRLGNEARAGAAPCYLTHSYTIGVSYGCETCSYLSYHCEAHSQLCYGCEDSHLSYLIF